jgi:cell division protein FtsL
MERELRALEEERALVEAERLSFNRQIEELGSRTRVMRVARQRLGMHLPEDDEIIFLPAVRTSAPAVTEGAR